MSRRLLAYLRSRTHRVLRAALTLLPRQWRHATYRALVRCEPQPDARLQLKVASTQAELEACFSLLHDAYVRAGFMQPHPSGLRVTAYHALPTTTTLCALMDGRVVGTLSLIRDGVFGFPMQTAFDLSSVRQRGGQIAEISALAVAPDYQRSGGAILFPLMKFMYEYSRRCFDTRHLVIAVNPRHIELYEALLFFERLPDAERTQYDFANGAPAVAATLDLEQAEARFARAYGGRPAPRNLHRYFVQTALPNIQWPLRALHTTNDPVLTPALLDHFFNRRTALLRTLDERRRLLLRALYDQAEYAAVLPRVDSEAQARLRLRRQPRFSLKCPAQLRVQQPGADLVLGLTVTDISRHGLRALLPQALPPGTVGQLTVDLGLAHQVCLRVRLQRLQPVQRLQATAGQAQASASNGALRHGNGAHAGRAESSAPSAPSARYGGFALLDDDAHWQRCVQALARSRTQDELQHCLHHGTPESPQTHATAATLAETGARCAAAPAVAPPDAAEQKACAQPAAQCPA